MKLRLLILSILILSFTNEIDAQTLPPNVVLPENIIVSDCFTRPPVQTWSIAFQKSKEFNLSPYQNPVVGDIDGDGIVEILLSADPKNANTIADRSSNKIAIYKGNNIQLPPKIITTRQDYNWDAYTKYAIIRTQIASKDSVIIVVAERDYNLRAYNADGDLIWVSDQKYMTKRSPAVTVTFGDLNKDGIPEILINNKVYDSRNGVLLCQTDISYQGYAICIPLAEDIYLEGKTRFIQGNMIFKPDDALTKLELEKKIPLTVNNSDPDITNSLPTIPDGGRTVVADIDLDGKPELIISTTVGNYTFIFIADPVTAQIKASKIIPDAKNSSYPFVGDIDGDGYPEIVFITHPGFKMLAYKYESGNPVLRKFWELPHADASGMTAMTLFDFNHDGISEIVYRDEKKMRIINGSLVDHITGNKVNSPYNLADYYCTSGTSTEYPVVADVDNDGQAEIVIVGGDESGPDRFVAEGCLWIFKSADLTRMPWASARSVWNQYAYNSLNVNDDLSVPKVPMSPATRFAGEDGILGNADDVSPYNNFLQQQTSLNKNGTPFWLAANAQIKGTPIMKYDMDNDSMTVTIKVRNEGEIAFQNPFYITLYKDNVGNKRKQTHIHKGVVGKNEEVDMTFVIPNYQAEWTPNEGIVINLNDKGDGLPQQSVCDNTKAQYTYYGIVPTSISTCIKKDKRTLTCNFTVPGGSNSYQWQLSQNNTDWQDIFDETDNKIDITTDKRMNIFYRVRVIAGAKTVYSNPVNVTVNNCFMPINPNISIMNY